MKLFRRTKKRNELVIRTEEIQVGDRFVFDGLVEVNQIHKIGKKDPTKVYVRLQILNPLDHSKWGYRSVALHRDPFITVSR